LRSSLAVSRLLQLSDREFNDLLSVLLLISDLQEGVRVVMLQLTGLA